MTTPTTPFLGLRTAMYHVGDLARAKAWYSDVLGFGPYFDEPFYVGFEVGGYELGLNPDMTNVTPGGGAYAYWGVEDAHAAYQRLLSLGATAHEPVNEVGGGILVGTVKDPWDNVLGVIQNPHFKLA
jgi:predicted enzyme related to lactoylglutathione lyase